LWQCSFRGSTANGNEEAYQKENESFHGYLPFALFPMQNFQDINRNYVAVAILANPLAKEHSLPRKGMVTCEV
jgi:hypothetical protein